MSIPMLRRLVRTSGFWVGAAALALAGCDDDSVPGPATVTPTYAISGTVSGLASGGSVVLNDNAVDPLTLTSSGAFAFPTRLQAGAAYSVSVATQPTGQTCVVANGSGSVPQSGAASINVVVTCAATVVTPTYTIGGTVSGLAAGTTVTLQDNGGDSLAVSAAGPFTFATPLAGGAAYAVTVQTQPAGATCVVGGGSGTVAAANVASVTLTCAVTGLASSTTSSTAFAVLATSTTRVAFLPGPSGVIAFAIDGTAVAARGPRALAAGRVKTAAVAAPQVALSFTPDSCTVDSSALIVSCIAYQGTKLAFLDVSRFATSLKASDITAAEFESGVPTASTSFSGGSCVLCGIVALTGQSRIVVSASDGYRIYGYPAAGAASPLVPTKSYSVPITENFAVDPVRLRIAASEYYANSGARKLRLIDIATDRIYTWVTATDTCATSDGTACSSDFQYEETDSETFDVATGMLIMQSESGYSQLLLDLSQATFDSTALTFDAPHLYASVTNPYGVEMSGALASPANSWLFMVPEFSSAYAGVSALPPASGASGAFPAYTAQPIFVDLNAANTAGTCGSGLQSGGDPHSEGFTTSLAGVDVGLFITGDRTCIVKVDLKALYNAPRSTSDPTQVDPTYDLVGHNVLSYLPVQ